MGFAYSICPQVYDSCDTEHASVFRIRVFFLIIGIVAVALLEHTADSDLGDYHVRQLGDVHVLFEEQLLEQLPDAVEVRRLGVSPLEVRLNLLQAQTLRGAA